MAWSIFQQDNGALLALTFAHDFLVKLGAPVNVNTMQCVFDWEVSEGGGGENNPLNCGAVIGLALSGNQYGGGAADYGSLDNAITASVGILLAPANQQYGYSPVVEALRNGFNAKSQIWASDWAASHYGNGTHWANTTIPSTLLERFVEQMLNLVIVGTDKKPYALSVNNVSELANATWSEIGGPDAVTLAILNQQTYGPDFIVFAEGSDQHIYFSVNLGAWTRINAGLAGAITP